MSEAVSIEAPHPKRSPRWLLAPLLAFALFSLLAGLLAKAYVPEPGVYPGGYFDLFFSDTIHMKAWLASAAVALALFQLFTAAWIFRKLPWRKPGWVNPAHRWSGRLAFVATLPVAYHCIFKLGFQSGDHRVLRRFPGHTLPIMGGLLFAVLIGVWYTSAVWLFRLVGVGL